MNILWKTLCILLLGSAAAPIFYVILGVVRPEGFHNLIGVDISVILAAFITAWSFSASITIISGALLWKLIHSKKWDGIVVYILLASTVYLMLSLIINAPLSLIGFGMSAANAIAVRMFEWRMLKVEQDKITAFSA